MILLEFGLGILLCAAAISGSILIIAESAYALKIIYTEFKRIN